MSTERGSDVRLTGTAVRDAELAMTPGGTPVTQIDLALEEYGRVVYATVRCEGDLARKVCAEPTRGNLYRVGGHLWRQSKSPQVPYPPLVVVARYFERVRESATGNLFEEAGMQLAGGTK